LSLSELVKQNLANKIKNKAKHMTKRETALTPLFELMQKKKAA
jgi:hypothetical protein